MHLKKLLPVLLAAMLLGGAQASRAKGWFAGASLGTNFTVVDNSTEWHLMSNLGRALGTSFGVDVGHYFTPHVGLRGEFAYMKQHARANDEAVKHHPEWGDNGFYGYDVLAGYIDFLYNFSESKAHPHRKWSIVGIAGLGINGATHYDSKAYEWAEVPVEDAPFPNFRKRGDSKPTYLVGRLGVMASYEVARNLDITLEGNGNVTGDELEGIDFDRKVNFYFNAKIGLAYSF